jgi:dienelactone hydrolase
VLRIKKSYPLRYKESPAIPVPRDAPGETRLHDPAPGLYGGLDQGIPPETVEKMKALLASATNLASPASRIHSYPDAPHAFHADDRPSLCSASFFLELMVI